jgi:hypothetical protein
MRLAYACLAAAILAAIVGIAVPAGFGWDFANFYDTGRRAAAGQVADIYHPSSSIAGLAPQGGMTFWGAPVSAWFYAPLSLLPAGVALIVFKGAGTLCYAVGLLLLFRHAVTATNLLDDRRTWFAGAFALLILAYQPFWTMYRVGGQTTPAVFLLFILGLLSYEEDRPVATSVCLLLAVLIKPAMLFVPAFLALVSGRRFFLVIAGVFLAGGLASLVAVGVPIHREFFEMLREGSTKHSPWFFNSSLYILADVLRPISGSAPAFGADGAGMASLAGLALKAAVVGMFVALLLRFRRTGLEGAARRRCLYLLAISFGLLISQVVWEHYLAILFIPLAYLVAASDRVPSGGRKLLATIFALSLLQNIILVEWFRQHVEISTHAGLLAVSLVKSGPLLLYLVWLMRYNGPMLTSFSSGNAHHQRAAPQPALASPGHAGT